MDKQIVPARETAVAMPLRVVQTMPPSWLVDGYLAAVERVRVAVAANEDTGRGVSIAVAEALMWIAALSDTRREVGRGHDLAALLNDPLVKALYFVRGRVQHHWAPVAARYDGKNWGWLSADNLPLSGLGHADPKGKRLYRQRLEHRPILEALEEVAQRLENVARP